MDFLIDLLLHSLLALGLFLVLFWCAAAVGAVQQWRRRQRGPSES